MLSPSSSPSPLNLLLTCQITWWLAKLLYVKLVSKTTHLGQKYMFFGCNNCSNHVFLFVSPSAIAGYLVFHEVMLLPQPQYVYTLCLRASRGCIMCDVFINTVLLLLKENNKIDTLQLYIRGGGYNISSYIFTPITPKWLHTALYRRRILYSGYTWIHILNP